MWIAIIYEADYPAGAGAGLLIKANNYADAESVFKIRFPDWESLNYEIIEFS